MTTWEEGAGVVEFPDGRRVRARSLRRQPPPRPLPDFGVYLLARPPQGLSWDHRWIRCGDFRAPHDREHALLVLREAYERATTQRVEIACGGGIGRTGIALAVLAVFAGISPSQAVPWVRFRYHPRAVEMPWQRRWVSSISE